MKKLAPEAAMRALQRAAAGKERAELLQRDGWAAGAALMQLGGSWNPERQSEVIAFLRHDDGSVRWGAQEILAEHAGPKLDGALEQLLTDADARVRGLALYLAVKNWGPRGINAAKSALASPQELVRYDALSALLLHGGHEGKAAVDAYRASAKEPSAALKEWLDAVSKPE
ncbi:MAG TPA: hypothetical protein VF911_11940 [Thermoanaerobaculia bacterium]